VFLKPGETKRVSIRLGDEAFRFYNIECHDFMVESGTFTVYVASSSADIRLTGKLEIPSL
jgi:beta-glucosidase